MAVLGSEQRDGGWNYIVEQVNFYRLSDSLPRAGKLTDDNTQDRLGLFHL